MLYVCEIEQLSVYLQHRIWITCVYILYMPLHVYVKLQLWPLSVQ